MKDLLVCAVHLIIATPGRILDLMNKNLVHADHCKMLVLDEVSSAMCSVCNGDLSYSKNRRLSKCNTLHCAVAMRRYDEIMSIGL